MSMMSQKRFHIHIGGLKSHCRTLLKWFTATLRHHTRSWYTNNY